MGHYSSQTQIKAREQNGATIQVTSLVVIEVRPAALVQIRHPPDHDWKLEQVYPVHLTQDWNDLGRAIIRVEFE